jgi:DNA-binding NarL/FixJ family response regulator
VSAPAKSTPRLLIAAHAATRIGIRIALHGLVSVEAEAATAEDAVAVAESQQPDLCIMSLEIPGAGVQTVAQICAVAPSAATFVLSNLNEPDDLLGCIQAGAIGYLPDNVAGPALRRAVVSLLAGEAVIPRTRVLELVHEVQCAAGDGFVGLTARQEQVMKMVRRVQPTSTIAQRLGISPVTVRRHISATRHKAGLTDRKSLSRSRPGSAAVDELPTVASAELAVVSSRRGRTSSDR